MAHHPFGRVPSVSGLVDPEEVDVPVEVGRQVPRRHPREAPKVALEPRAQVVHCLHPVQADRVVLISPVCPALEPADPDRHAVRPLQIVDGQRPEQHSAAHGFHCARRAGLPVAEDDRGGVPMDIDGDSDARLFTG